MTRRGDAATKRAYVSPVREAAAARRRSEVLAAATQFLRERDIPAFSLDAVAKASGVTRLTVYNQFGSRRGLLEAVLDELAEAGGLTRLPLAVQAQDPFEALDRLIGIFCDFWGGDIAVARLHDAIAIDREFGEALIARNEMRREVLASLLDRMPLPAATAEMKSDAVDLMFTLTSCATYRSLRATKPDASIRRIITEAGRDAVARLERPGPPGPMDRSQASI